MKKRLLWAPKRLAFISVIAGLFLIFAPATAATKTPSTSTGSKTTKTPSTNISSDVTQSYNATGAVQEGMLVQLASKKSNTVIPLTQANVSDMLGVVVPPNNATIVLTPASVTEQQVLVATSGHYNVLVSNQNGPINVGDYITISSIEGVGMKADATEGEVLGKAAGAFTGVADVIGTVPLRNSQGETSNVNIGRIPVDLTIARNPLYQRAADYVPQFLSKVAVTVARKPVSSARIYLSMAVLVITGIVTGNMLYSGVRNGMIAVGRNPLSKKSIIKSLIETVVAGMIIFIVGILAVYLLLRL